jgi:hypothetical protein
MKREKHLIHKILSYVANGEDPMMIPYEDLSSLPSVDQEKKWRRGLATADARISYHMKLLVDEGFVYGIDEDIFCGKLTWKGNDLLDRGKGENNILTHSCVL